MISAKAAAPSVFATLKRRCPLEFFGQMDQLRVNTLIRSFCAGHFAANSAKLALW